MITIIMDGQFGSCGKGAFTHWLNNERNPAAVIRTGGSQAGHSMIHKGKVYKMRQIPCAWDRAFTLLIIPPTAIIDPKVLQEEIAMVESLGYQLKGRLLIDKHATIIEEKHKQIEKDLKKKIGSTGEGVGAALADRIMRKAKLIKDYPIFKDYLVDDTTSAIHHELDDGLEVFIEATQGWGLSLYSSKFYPFCTSREISASALLADCGIPPNKYEVETLLLLRTFPIRVAGNSGPLKNEIKWEDLQIKPEITTVTKKIRRIGLWDSELAERAIKINNPTSIVLTFFDYLRPDLAGKLTLDKKALHCIESMGKELKVPIRYVATGFERVIDLGRRG